MIPWRRACLLATALCPACWEPLEPSLDEVDLGVDVRLNAVESDFNRESFIAVGAGGTVVRDDGRVWDLGDVELRDILRTPNDGGWPALWMVVGDSGTIVVGRQPDIDADIEWLVQASGTNADLYGITVFEGTTPIVVGDEVVSMGQPTAESGMFEWIAQPVPPGGWGRLRDIEVEYDNGVESLVRAAGLQGRIWLGVSGGVDEWLWDSIDAGTGEDLFDVDSPGRICGARGTIVTCDPIDPAECTSQSAGDYDFLSCAASGSIDSVQRIHSYGLYFPVAWQPRAIDEAWQSVVVGDGGHAGWWHSTVVLFW